MKIFLIQFYMTSLSFEVNHRISLYIEKQVNRAISKVKVDKYNKLWMFIDTKRVKKTQIGDNRRFGKKGGVRKQLYLPYLPLKTSKNFPYDFTAIVCDAIIQILLDFKIPPEKLKDVKEKCLREISGNPKYIYQNEDEIALQRRLERKEKGKKNNPLHRRVSRLGDSVGSRQVERGKAEAV